MSWRVPPYDRAVAEAEQFIRATWQVHGIVVSGSIVRGEAGPTSDLDIVLGVDTFFEWTSDRT